MATKSKAKPKAKPHYLRYWIAYVLILTLPTIVAVYHLGAKDEPAKPIGCLDLNSSNAYYCIEEMPNGDLQVNRNGKPSLPKMSVQPRKARRSPNEADERMRQALAYHIHRVIHISTECTIVGRCG